MRDEVRDEDPRGMSGLLVISTAELRMRKCARCVTKLRTAQEQWEVWVWTIANRPQKVVMCEACAALVWGRKVDAGEEHGDH